MLKITLNILKRKQLNSKIIDSHKEIVRKLPCYKIVTYNS